MNISFADFRRRRRLSEAAAKTELICRRIAYHGVDFHDWWDDVAMPVILENRAINETSVFDHLLLMTESAEEPDLSWGSDFWKDQSGVVESMRAEMIRKLGRLRHMLIKKFTHGEVESKQAGRVARMITALHDAAVSNVKYLDQEEMLNTFPDMTDDEAHAKKRDVTDQFYGKGDDLKHFIDGSFMKGRRAVYGRSLDAFVRGYKPLVPDYEKTLHDPKHIEDEKFWNLSDKELDEPWPDDPDSKEYSARQWANYKRDTSPRYWRSFQAFHHPEWDDEEHLASWHHRRRQMNQYYANNPHYAEKFRKHGFLGPEEDLYVR